MNNEYDFPEYGRQCELNTPWRGYHRGTIVAGKSSVSCPLKPSDSAPLC